jgi:capsule polysaccharide modification protein KpsS
MLPDTAGKSVLLLQGPVGPFFARLAVDLEAAGARVTKVNFHPGEDIFYRDRRAIAYRGTFDDWPAFCRDLLRQRQIDVVFLFGDCRPVHKRAIEACEDEGVPVWVFEEGYLRPHFITVEEGGVNGHSRLPKDPDFYRRATRDLGPLPDPEPVGNTFPNQVAYAILNAVAITLLGWRYPHYEHHRDVNAIRQAYCWVRGAGRKYYYQAREKHHMPRLVGPYSGRYVLVPLQVHCDSQLEHSDYARIEDFIDEVAETFAEAAPKDHLLVFKHHPFDRPYRDYTRHLRALGRRLGLADRIVYVHDLHLPTLLRHARGTVTMNSTVGTSSLHHGTPVKVMGRAIYDIPGLTDPRPLVEFLREPQPVDEALYAAFCRYLRETNQINGSFYKRLPGAITETGLRPLPDRARRGRAPLRLVRA